MEQGYSVSIAITVDAGLEYIVSEKPDLLILGINLPDVFALLHRVRADPGIPRLPVITILRSWGHVAEIRKGWDLGVDTFLSAAFHPLELRAIVKRLFKSIDEDQDEGAKWPAVSSLIQTTDLKYFVVIDLLTGQTGWPAEQIRQRAQYILGAVERAKQIRGRGLHRVRARRVGGNALPG